MFPVIPLFAREGVRDVQIPILDELLTILPILVENTLKHLCTEPEVQAKVDSEEKVRTIKEMELIQKVAIPLALCVVKSIVKIPNQKGKTSPVRQKCFE